MTTTVFSIFLVTNAIFVALLLFQSKKVVYHGLSGMHIIMIPLLVTIVEAYYMSCCFLTIKEDYKILLIFLGLSYFLFPCLLVYFLLPKMAPFKIHETLGGTIGALYGRRVHIFIMVSNVISLSLMLMVLLMGVSTMVGATGIHQLFTIVGVGILGTLYARYSSIRKIKGIIILSFMVFLGISGWWAVQVLMKYKGVQNIFSEMLDLSNKAISSWGTASPNKMIFFLVLQLYLTLITFSSPTVIPTILAMYKNKQKTVNKINNIAIFYPLIRFLTLMSIFGFFLADIPLSADFLCNILKSVKQFAGSKMHISIVLLVSCVLMITTAVFISLIRTLERMINLDMQHITGKIRPISYKIPHMIKILGSTVVIGACLLSFVPHWGWALLGLAFTIGALYVQPFLFGILTLKGHEKCFFGSILGFLGSIAISVLLRPYFAHIAIGDYLGYSFLSAILLSTLLFFMLYILFKKERIAPNVVYTSSAYTMGGSGKHYTHPWFCFKRWANSQMKIYPFQPRALGFLLIMVHVFAMLKHIGKGDFPIVLMSINTIGLVLANLLMWHAHFPFPISHFLPYYWLFTIFYCLPFNGTLSFLFQPEDNSVLLQFLFGIFLMGFLVDRASFLLLNSLGIILALVVHYIESNQPYALFTFKLTWRVVLGLLYTYLLSLLFNNRKNYSKQKDFLAKNKIVITVFNRYLQNQLSTMPAKELANLLHDKVITSKKGSQEVIELKLKDYENFIIYSSDIMRLTNVCKMQLKTLEEMIYRDYINPEHIVSRNIANVMQSAHHQLMLIYRNRVKLLDESTNFSIYVFPTLFHHAIANLVENAFWYGDAREMEIWWSAEKRMLYIKDNGREIPQHLHASLFDPIDEPEKRIVGLRFVKMVMDLLGAKISFSSKPSGSTFSIQFPPMK